MDVKALGILNTLSLVLKIPCSLLEKLSVDTHIHSKTSTYVLHCLRIPTYVL